MGEGEESAHLVNTFVLHAFEQIQTFRKSFSKVRKYLHSQKPKKLLQEQATKRYFDPMQLAKLFF